MTGQRDEIGFHLPQLGLLGDLSEPSCVPREGTQEGKGQSSFVYTKFEMVKLYSWILPLTPEFCKQ